MILRPYPFMRRAGRYGFLLCIDGCTDDISSFSSAGTALHDYQTPDYEFS
jgi:hypothetical protein